MPKAAGRKTGGLFCLWVLGGSGAYAVSAGSYGLCFLSCACCGTCVRGRESPGGDPISFVLPKETGERKGAPCRRLVRQNSLRACSAPFKHAAGDMKDFHVVGARRLRARYGSKLLD
jgi:hypothetical protein